MATQKTNYFQALHMIMLGDTKAWFISDFFACREQFLQAVQQLEKQNKQTHSWTLTPNDVPHLYVDNLATDAVYIGDPKAKNVLVLISATHGVEGYCGSAVQRFLLHQLAQKEHRLPNHFAILMIHGLNPWGMHWARRCDQNGIDLNRNIVDFNALPDPDPAYENILACLQKRDAAERQLAMSEQIAFLGQKKFDELFSGGQYHCDWAPFYGGRSPALATRVIEDCISSWRLAEKELVVIDLHSGLGPWGFGELISDHDLMSPGNAFAQTLFGAAVAITALDGSFSVAKKGLQDYRWHKLMAQSGCFLTLEFGSYGTKPLFDVLLDEHLFWSKSCAFDETSEEYLRHRHAMINHFFPNDTLWQEAVLFKSWQVFKRVLEVYL